MNQHLHYRASRRKEREKGIKNVYNEIMAENFPNLMKETGIQVQEAQRVPNKVNTNRPTLIHIIIKMTNDKYRDFYRQQEKNKESYTRESP